MPDGNRHHPTALSEAQWEELKESLEQVIRGSLDTPTKVEDARLQLGRLVSHLDSERRVSAMISDMVHQHQRVIYGEGENTGLRGRMNRIMDISDTVQDHQRAIYGVGEKPGLQGTVNGLVTAHNHFIRALWMMITVGVGLLGATVYNIILQYGK